MTIQRARELLGSEADNLTDDQILLYLKETTAFCSSILDDLMSGKLKDLENDLFTHREDVIK